MVRHPFGLIAVVNVLFLAMYPGGIGSGFGNDLNPPYLYEPCVENIDLKGKDSVEFRWKLTGAANTDNFDVKIYSGYDAGSENLIIHKKAAGSQNSFSVSAQSFESGQIYSWELYKVLFGGRKSQKSHCSFTINHK